MIPVVPDIGNARREGESFDDYKSRQRMQNKMISLRKKGIYTVPSPKKVK